MAYRVTAESFSSLEQEWTGVLHTCTLDTIFLTPLWQRVWWETLTPDGELLLLAFRGGTTGEDGLLGIAPLMAQGNTLSFLGEKDLFDYHDFLVPTGKEGLFYPALVEHLASRQWDQVRLFSIPAGSPTLTHLPTLAQARGWRCQVTQEDVAPGLELPQTWDQYLMGLSKKDRHELRRKLRRMASLGQPVHRICENGRDVAASMEAFLTLMRESREEKHRFLTPEREGFFRAVAEALAAQGLLHLHLLELGGRQAAAVLCFDYRGHRLLYNSGYDTAYGPLSAGLLLKAECLREAIEKGLSYYDFLRGAEPYKYDLGARDHPLYSMTLSR